MPNNSRFRNARTVVLAGAALLGGCVATLPPPPASNPADAQAPEAATQPWRPTLLADARTFMPTPAMKRPPGEQSAEAFYTCPMHPQIKEARPGNCPICGMTLIRQSAAAEGAKP